MSFTTLYTWEYKEEGGTGAHCDGNEAGIFYAELLYLVALCQGSPVMKGMGRLECFPPLRWVCLGWGKNAGWR